MDNINMISRCVVWMRIKKPPSPIGFGGFIDEMVKNRRSLVYVGKVLRRGCSAYL